MLCLAILFPVNLYLALAPGNWWPWLWGFLQLTPPASLSFRVTVVEIALIYCAIAHLLEVCSGSVVQGGTCGGVVWGGV